MVYAGFSEPELTELACSGTLSAMTHRRVRRYMVVPFVYVAVIFTLLYLQFSGNLTVRRTLGPLQFTGTLEAGEDDIGYSITAARLEFAGLIVELSADSPVIIRVPDGEDEILVPIGYRVEDEYILIELDDASILRFEVLSRETMELQIVPEGSDQWPQDGTLVLPWRFAPGVRLGAESVTGQLVRDIRVNDRYYFFSVPARSTIELNTQIVELPLDQSLRMIRFAEQISRDVDIIATAFSDGQRRITDEFYRGAISQFRDVAYLGWSTTRLNAGSGTWAMRDASPRFSEEVLTAYLAEEWDRGQFVTAFNQMRRAADLHPDQIGRLSAVFLGNLRAVWPAAIAEDERQAEALAARIARDDVSVFHREDLLEFAALRGNEEVFRDALRLASEVSLHDIDVPLAISLAATHVLSSHPTADSRSTTRRFLELFDDVVLPAVRQFDERFFIETGQNEIDPRVSLRAGVALERSGRMEGNQLHVTVGRNLVLSVLQLADSNGFIPRLIFFDESGIQRQEGAFGPEEIYQILIDNPSYPRMVSLYDEVGAGTYIWTLVPFPEIDISPDQWSFTLEYPRNRTHFVLIRGVPRFGTLNLFNLVWRNDPSFELYIKGRHYDAATQTLMIKYTDDSVRGDIIITF